MFKFKFRFVFSATYNVDFKAEFHKEFDFAQSHLSHRDKTTETRKV